MSKRNKLRNSKEVNNLATAAVEKKGNLGSAFQPQQVVKTNNIASVVLELTSDHFTATDHNGHKVSIPCDLNGLRVLKLMLRAKQLSPQAKLGSTAVPTQRMIDDFLKNKKLEEEVREEESYNEIKDLF